MVVFKDKTAHETWVLDLSYVQQAFNGSKTRLVENALSTLMDTIYDEIYDNLTVEGQFAVDAKVEENSDLDVLEAIEQLDKEKPGA